jgi:DNA modification methylase
VTIRIVEGDARELPGVPDRSVHLVVTSPPYPMIPQWDRLFERLGARDFAAMHAVLGAVWARCYELLVPGGLLVVNIGDALRSDADGFRLWPNHVGVTQGCERLGFRSLPYLLWKKPTNRPNAFLGSGFLPPNAYVTLDCEPILIFRKGSLRPFPRKATVRSDSRYTRAERDHWFSQVWDDVRGVRQSRGAARTGAFPPEIPSRLIRMFSCRGETVLDPFAGTGTTLWEAERWGRDSIGVEIDPELCRVMRDRAAALTTGTTAVGSGPAAGPGGATPRRRRGAGSSAKGR